MFVLSIFVQEFLDKSSSRKSFRFPQVLIWILSSELNIFHFIVLLLRAKSLDEVNIAVWRIYDVIGPLNNNLVKCSFLFPMVQKV